ncbi:MAG: hypothetical protein LBS09_04010 [Bacteroidales bacterium]|nr:hypothetical protein [Bacteroidales bacterium]
MPTFFTLAAVRGGGQVVPIKRGGRPIAQNRIPNEYQAARTFMLQKAAELGLQRVSGE